MSAGLHFLRECPVAWAIRMIMAKTALWTVLVATFVATSGSGQEAGVDSRFVRNMVSTARGLPARLTDENMLWRVELKARNVYGQPVIVGDRVLIGMDSRTFASKERFPKQRADLVCLDRRTGALIWHSPCAPAGPWYAVHGYTSTPWVESDRVYVVAPDGQAQCLDLDGMADGNDGPFVDEEIALRVEKVQENEVDIIWQYNFSGRHGVSAHDSYSSDPLIVGDLFIFGTSHSAGVKPSSAWVKPKDIEGWQYVRKPNLLALDKNTGEFVAQDEIDIEQIFHGQWSSPTLVHAENEPVIVWGDGFGMLHGFGMPEDGVFPHLWRIDMNPPEFRAKEGEEVQFPLHHATREQKAGGPGHVIAKPVYHDGRIYVGTGRDHYYTNHPGGRIATPGVFRCIDVSDPRDVTQDDVLWEKRIIVTQSTASISNGLLFVADGTGTLHCLDPETGDTYWTHDLGADVTCRSQLLADGKVYVGTDKGGYFVFAVAREKNLLFETEFEGRSATPGAVDGMIIIPTTESVTAYGTVAE